jgi:hypothetical protein
MKIEVSILLIRRWALLFETSHIFIIYFSLNIQVSIHSYKHNLF